MSHRHPGRDYAARPMRAIPMLPATDEPELRLLLAVVKLAHRDSRSRDPHLAEPAAEWLREIELEAMEVQP